MKPDLNLAKYFIEEKQGLIVPIAAIALVLPFMFIAMFLFHRDFVMNYPYWISFLFSFCLSIVHYWFTLAHIDLEGTKMSNNQRLFNGAIQSILIICFQIFIAYLFCQPYSFIDFIITLTMIDAILFVFAIIFSLYQWKKNKVKKK